MCDVLDRAEMRGEIRGRQQGIQSSRKDDLLNLMKNLNWSPIQAMDALSIPEAEREKYKELLNQ